MGPASQPHLTAAARSARSERDARIVMADFDDAPFTIAWEVTRACAYACAHCRADAQPRRDPRELDTDEALALIDDLAGFDASEIRLIMRENALALSKPQLVSV